MLGESIFHKIFQEPYMMFTATVNNLGESCR
jgi:hypothetical protein